MFCKFGKYTQDFRVAQNRGAFCKERHRFLVINMFNFLCLVKAATELFLPHWPYNPTTHSPAILYIYIHCATPKGVRFVTLLGCLVRTVGLFAVVLWLKLTAESWSVLRDLERERITLFNSGNYSINRFHYIYIYSTADYSFIRVCWVCGNNLIYRTLWATFDVYCKFIKTWLLH